MKKHKKLSPKERDLIAIWIAKNLSKRTIAKRLKRSHSTIVREIRRNSFKGKYYEAIHAQHRADKRIKKARKRHSLKNKDVYAYTLQKLRCGWSPEQIAGRLEKEHPKDPHWHICHETIYTFIYAEKNKSKRLWEYLPRKQKKRKKEKWKKNTKGRNN